MATGRLPDQAFSISECFHSERVTFSLRGGGGGDFI